MVMVKQLKAIISKDCPTHIIKIYIAGDKNLARQVLQEYVMRGMCVSISDEEYIYTMGNETGIVVNLINYPRFPKSAKELLNEATELAHHLLEKLHQGSCTVADYCGETYFLTRREDDRKDEIIEAAKYLSAEVADAWKKGRISIDTINAAENFDKLVTK